jgi:hypothetical protein
MVEITALLVDQNGDVEVKKVLHFGSLNLVGVMGFK